MKFPIATLFLLFSITADCQLTSATKNDSSKNIRPNKKEDLAFICVLEFEAKINGKHWQDYLTRSLALDSLAADTIPAGIYKVIANFVIDKSGKIAEVRIDNDPGYDLGKKVTSTLLAYPARWIPAERNGRKIKAFRRQAFTFIVEEEERCKELPTGIML